MYHKTDVHIGRRLRERRMALGMSQAELAEGLGISFQQVQKYEKGVNRIGASRLFDLAHVLGVPIQFFYEEMPASLSGHLPAPGFADAPGQGFVSEFLTSRDAVELSKAFARIQDPRVRRSIVELVRAIAGEDTTRSKPE